jgi:hypothetical protein
LAVSKCDQVPCGIGGVDLEGTLAHHERCGRVSVIVIVCAGTADKHRGKHEEDEQKATVILQGLNPLSSV